MAVTTAMPTVAYRALAPLVLMGLIFWLSAQPDLSTGLGAWDLIARKLAHMAEYGLLLGLWVWALSPLGGRPLLGAFVITLAYAVSDEWHQGFVDGRHGTPIDVAIDTAGMGLAALLVSRRPESSDAIRTRETP